MINNIKETLVNIYEISKFLEVKNKKIKILFSVALSNIVVVLDLLIIYLITSFFQQISLPNYFEFINLGVLREVLPVFILLRFIVIYLDAMNIHRLRLDIEENLRVNFLDEIFLRGNFSISDSYFYINTLCVHVSNFYQNFTILITSFVKFTLFTLFLVFTEENIFFIFIFGLLILAIPSRYFTRLNRKYSHISYQSSSEISNNVERVVDNLYLIKILNKFKYEKSLFSESLSDYYYAQFNNQKYGTLNSIFPSFVTMFLLSLLMIFSPVKSLVTIELIAIILRLFQSLGEFNRVYSVSIATYVHLEKLLTLEKNKEKIYSKNFVKEQSNSKYIIDINNIKFKYLNSDRFIFKNLSLNIERGKHTIITGPNGIGKSTFLGLVSGVFYSQEGLVNLSTSKVSYVSAYPMIIRGTLRENILYGVSEKIEDNEIIKKVHEFKIFENKDFMLDQQVSNKTLSSGQMQKLSFIRALMSNPELLLLDESTANLDSQSKILIYKILNSLDITILNSTHSLDELTNYDIELKFVGTTDGTLIHEV